MRGSILPSVEFVRECLRYEDGKLFWRERPIGHFKSEADQKTWNKQFSGKEAGDKWFDKINKVFRHRVAIRNRRYLRSRLVCFIHHGIWPKVVDHEDRNTLNDRIENLRPCTQFHNRGNCCRRKDSTTGYKGVGRSRKKYVARIKINRNMTHIGTFDTPEEAHDAYMELARKYFGEFARGE